MFCLLVICTSKGITISAAEKITHSPLCVCVCVCVCVCRGCSYVQTASRRYFCQFRWLTVWWVCVGLQTWLPTLSLYSTVGPVHPHTAHTCRHISPGAFITEEKLKPCTNSLQPGAFLSPGMTFSLKQIALPTSPLMTANPLPVPQHIFMCIYVAFFSFSNFIVLLSSWQ